MCLFVEHDYIYLNYLDIVNSLDKKNSLIMTETYFCLSSSISNRRKTYYITLFVETFYIFHTKLYISITTANAYRLHLERVNYSCQFVLCALFSLLVLSQTAEKD